MESSTSSIPPVSNSLEFPPSPHLPDISIKLASTNYLLWKAQVIPILHGNGLFGYVQNQVPCPSQTIINEDGVSPTSLAAVMWLHTDQLILGWINSSLSDGSCSKSSIVNPLMMLGMFWILFMVVIFRIIFNR